jgi:hypothetical protein
LLREQLYQKIRYHFQFQNELKLFPEIGNREKFSINIYSNVSTGIFSHMSNLFHTSTVDASFNHNNFGFCDGIKNDKDQWNLIGHSARIVSVDSEALTLFARLYDEAGTPALQARLPVVHSRQVVGALQKFAAQPKRLGDLEGEYFSTEMWHETNAEKNGTIKRSTQFAKTPGVWILSGPHFYIGKPLHQTPKAICETHRAYANLDLTTIPDDYLPRTNYVPAGNNAIYRNHCPKVPWNSKNPVIDYPRVVASRRLSQSGERTLQGAIIPKGPGHINTVFSISFRDVFRALGVAATWMSLPFDFFIKTTGKADFRHDLAGQLPILGQQWKIQLALRTLMLNCLTTHYTELWEECWDEAFHQDRWTKDDPRLDNSKFTNLTPKWQRNCALRTDYERRQALVEIDVLTAMALDLTNDELCTIYRIQFPVLRQNENDTWYDQNGRIVFTCSKGLPGVGFSRSEWNDIKDMTSGTVSRTIMDDTLPGGPQERTITYAAPFDRCDREADYATAWAAFGKRGVR